MENESGNDLNKLARQFFESLQDFFLARVIGAVAVFQSGTDQPKFEIASGCLVIIDEFLVWLTAGHFLAEIQAQRSAGTFQGMSFLYVVNNSIAMEAAIDVEAADIFFHENTEALDVGFILINPQLTDVLHKAGVKAMPIERFVGYTSDDKTEYRFLTGFSAHGSVLKNAIIHQYESNGKQFNINSTSLDGIAGRYVWLGNPEVDFNNPFRIMFKPIAEDTERTVGGMSGGPIVAVRGGEHIRDFHVIGIQSGERHIERRNEKFIKHIWCYDAAAVIEAVRAQIARLLDPAGNRATN